MSGRFVRASKYRHIYGKPTRKESCYDNLHISRNAWDTNLIKANPLFLSVNWESSGGGSFAVVPLHERGKLPDLIPLARGHTAPVLDTDWNPFNDYSIASSSDDGRVCLWEIPKDFTLYTPEDEEEPTHLAPIATLKGHSRKVGQVLFNPAVENILLSAGGDYLVNIWNIGTGQVVRSLKHVDTVQSLAWNAPGTLLVTTSRDKKIRVWDVRQEKAIAEHAGHAGAKNSRVAWMGEHNRFVTTGFSRMSERQMALWEPGRTEPINGFTRLDTISGVCMPFWDEGSNCVYLAGKGDGNIRYYEYENDKFEYLSEYKSVDPQRGVAFVPRRGIEVRENEVMRGYKTVNDTYIEPISFMVPRRAETFQSDIFPPAVGSEPALSAEEWLAGKSALPPKIDLESVFDGAAPKKVAAATYDASVESKAATAQAQSASTPPAAEPKKASAPAPAAVISPPRSIPDVKEQNAAISAVASKFKDDEDVDGVSQKAKEDEEAHSKAFDEATRPKPRSTASSSASPSTTTEKATATTTSKPTIITTPSTSSSVSSATQRPSSSPSKVASAVPQSAQSVTSPEVTESLADIRLLLENQTRLLAEQNNKITLLTTQLETLRRQVEANSPGEVLSPSLGKSSVEQSDRIRELELELEAARS